MDATEYHLDNFKAKFNCIDKDNCKLNQFDFYDMVNFAEQYHQMKLNEKVICPNCDEECEPISMGRMCNKCFYDKL